MNTTKSIIGAVVALAVGVVIGYFVFHTSTQTLVGAVGVKYAENYDPYIKYNGGYNSLLPIQTASSITAASESISGISNTATTSITGNFCVYNGSNFTTISFASGSTTPAYATSTTCQ